VDFDLDRWLPQRVQHREIGYPGDGRQHVLYLVRRALERLEIVAEELHRVLALHARCRLFDVVLDVLREIELDAWELIGKRVRDLRRQPFFVDAPRPGIERPQRDEEFGIEETGRVGAVVWTAVLRDDGRDLRETLDDAPHAIDGFVALLERDRGRHGRANPEIAFLELRQELKAERAHRPAGEHEEEQDGPAHNQHTLLHT